MMPKRKFDLIVFDWDGTLADSTAPIVHAMKEACRDLRLPVPDDVAARHVIGLGVVDAMSVVAPDLPASRYAEFGRRYGHHYLAREPEIPLFSGARELLADLEAAGFLLAVATGKSRAGLARMLELYGLERAFDATRCADEGLPKPHPDMLLHLMDLLAVDPDATLMVGDTTHDLDLARNAGAQSVAVAYGAHTSGDLQRGSPLAVVDSVPALREWLERNA
jgi:phosphoglycolate phosphatase